MNVITKNNVLEELLKLLTLEKIEENIFRGQSQDLGFGNVFRWASTGSGTIRRISNRYFGSQSSTAYMHIFSGRVMFPNQSFTEVDCIRDGKSFTTRRVVAIQKGRAIFNMSGSFQINESGFDHQDSAPKVPGPEGLDSELEIDMKAPDKIPDTIRDKILCKKPIEIRPVNPINPYYPEKRKPMRYAWFKTIDTMPDNPSGAPIFIGLCI